MDNKINNVDYFDIYNQEKIEIFMNLAKNSYTNIEILKEISNTFVEEIRVNLASNTALSKDLIEKLSEDESINVRSSLAKNPIIFNYDNIVEKLLNDNNEKVAASLLENSNINHILVEKIFNKSNSLNMRIALAKSNLVLTTDILFKLSLDTNIQVLFALSKRKDLLPGMLDNIYNTMKKLIINKNG